MTINNDRRPLNRSSREPEGEEFVSRSTAKGIRSYRKTASLIVGSGLLFATGAEAAEPESNVDPSVAAGAAVSAAAEEEEQPEAIVVTGERFRINTLNSRLPDVRDAPQSISIIPREIIEQQAASTLNDVLRNVSGISMAAGEGGGGPAGDNLTLRGFGARNDIFVDGIRDFASYTRDTFNVEQVAVVTGPASAPRITSARRPTSTWAERRSALERAPPFASTSCTMTPIRPAATM